MDIQKMESKLSPIRQFAELILSVSGLVDPEPLGIIQVSLSLSDWITASNRTGLWGAFADWEFDHNSFGQGGLYTAIYNAGWYGVIGGKMGDQSYAAFGTVGKDFNLRGWLIGPVAAVQYDYANKDYGRGTGGVVTGRVGGRIARDGGLIRPYFYFMGQGEGGNEDPKRKLGLYGELGATIRLGDRSTLYGSISCEGNDSYQEAQVNAGIRFQF